MSIHEDSREEEDSSMKSDKNLDNLMCKCAWTSCAETVKHACPIALGFRQKENGYRGAVPPIERYHRSNV